MRCVSNTKGEQGRKSLMNLWPKLMFGTKDPSITSKWTHEAPLELTVSTSSATREKSAESMLGAISIGALFIHIVIAGRGHFCNV